MGKSRARTVLKLIVSVFFGLIVVFLLFIFVESFIEAIRADRVHISLIVRPALAGLILSSMLVFLVLWNIVASKRVHFLHLVPVFCIAAWIGIEFLWEWQERPAPAVAVSPPPPEIIPTVAPLAELPLLPEIVVVSVAGGHTAAVGADGSLWTWGHNHLIPTRMGTDYGWATVATRIGHTVAIKTDGSLWAWGSNTHHAPGHRRIQDTPVRLGEDYDWASIALGAQHGTALRTDGTLWVWGSTGMDANGWIGNSSQIWFGYVPTQLGTDSDWVAVSARGDHTTLIRADGTLWVFGGSDSSFFVEDADGDGYNFFDGNYPVPGFWVRNNRRVPEQIGTQDRWVSVSNNGRHIVAVAADGSLWTFEGCGLQLCDNPWKNARRIGTDNDWVSVSIGGSASNNAEFIVAIKTDGSLWTWGRMASTSVPLTFFNYDEPTRIGTAADWVAVSAGSEHGIGIRAGGTLWAWGGNSAGQLGIGTRGHEQFIRRSPVQIGTDTDWVSVAARENQIVALKRNGTLWAWGDIGPFAFVGGRAGIHNRPIPAGADTDWVSVPSAASVGPIVAMRADASLWSLAQIGTVADDSGTAGIEGGSGWASASAGTSHRVGIRADGSLWSWGANHWSQLGRVSPAATHHHHHGIERIGEDNDWVSVFAGPGHNFAIRRDGSLWAWGNNSNGQLGIGAIRGQFDQRPDPLQVGTEHNWAGAVISMRPQHSAAVKADGSLWVWGGTAISGRRTAPFRIGTDSDWASVAAGGGFPGAGFGGDGHFVALKRNGSLWTWGNNNLGQLGDGTATNRSAPARIGTSYDWAAVSAGRDHSVALKTDGTLWAWGWNQGGQLGDGTENTLAPQRVGRL